MGTATTSVLAAAGVLAAYGVCSAVAGLRANIRAAKRSGFRYVVSPITPFSFFGQTLYWLWSPVVRLLLPKSWWEDWIVFLRPDWAYIKTHPHPLPQSTLVAAPGSLAFFTADAELVRQITYRRVDFPKEVGEYSILQQFGNNVLTAEGDAWRAHRKAVGGAFAGRDGLVFGAAARQAEGMVEKWMADQEGTGGSGKGGGGWGKPIRTIDRDTMRLALNVIASVGFGVPLVWAGQTLPEGTDPRLHKYASPEPAADHTMSFVDAVAGVLDNLLPLLLVPSWLLRRLPFRRARFAAESRRNYEIYSHELLSDKLEQHALGEGPPPGMDVMGHLVRSSSSPGEQDEKFKTPGRLSTSDIMGNAFIVIMAGHETTANALHFTILELAANPPAQRALQRDLDRLLEAADPSTWRYEDKIGPLLGGMMGSCMSETLRKVPSVTEIPKLVRGEQVVTVNGESRVLPPGVKISLVAMQTHRDPRYWPTSRSRISGKEHDLDDYVPERWFRTKAGVEDDAGGPDTPSSVGSQDSVFSRADDAETPGSSVTGGEDGEAGTGGSLFRPEKGVFLAFSEGPRACTGKRIAQVEIAAALAVVFQRFSIELAVDDFVGGDAEAAVEAMGRSERERVYKQAQERCRETIDGARSRLTLKLQGGKHVPVRLVRRGEERFVSWMD